MTTEDLGGDPPCWAHMLDDDAEESSVSNPVVVDLGVEAVGSGGAIWSLPRGGDLDANLVRLDGDSAIGDHVNSEVDVLLFVQAGSGEVLIDGTTHGLGPDHVVLIPVGASRSIHAGSTGLTYLSVHRRRGPLKVVGRR